MWSPAILWGLIPLGRLLNRPRLNRPSTSPQQTSITWSTGCTPLAAKIAKSKINGFHVTRDWCICMVCGMVMFYGIIYIYILCVYDQHWLTILVIVMLYIETLEVSLNNNYINNYCFKCFFLWFHYVGKKTGNLQIWFFHVFLKIEYIYYGENYDFWTAWARESSRLGIVIKKHFRKNIRFVLFFMKMFMCFLNDLLYYFFMFLFF